LRFLILKIKLFVFFFVDTLFSGEDLSSCVL